MFKTFQILFNDNGEGGTGGGGNQSGAGGNQDGQGGSQNGDGGSQTVTIEQFNKLSDEIRTIKTERDELKTKVKTYEEKKATENGEYQKLADDRQKEIERLTGEFTTAKEQADQWQNYQKERRKALTEVLPEDKRAYAKELQLTTLEKFVEDFKANGKPPGTDSGKSGEGVVIVPNKKWQDYTTAELDKIKETSPETHKQLYNDFINRR
jgi:hypothetical protein